MKELGIAKAEMDFMNEKSFPEHFLIRPLRSYFSELRHFISNRLEQLEFETDYITTGVFSIETSQIDNAFGTISIQCILQTKAGKTISGKVYRKHTYPIAESFFGKWIRSL